MNYENLKSLLFKLDPECAHNLASVGMKIAKNTPFLNDYIKKSFCYENEILSQNLLGLKFANPLGIGGGFDKNADLIKPLSLFGFGFLEYGTFTPKAQFGNEKPRLWRLIDEKSLQNAMGFNNKGANAILKQVKNAYPYSVPVFANIGKNKLTPNDDALKDYEILAQNFSEFCDGFVINISSPNTPNLRDLQSESFISELFSALRAKSSRPLLLKIAPDMSPSTAVEICDCAINNGAKALIINNTSIDYSLSQNAKSRGGLSGELIKEKSRALFSAVARELYSKALLISCGGISDAKDALWRIKQGASLLEIFTAFIYQGPSLCKNINENLAQMLKDEGFSNISQAIGADIA